MSTQTAWKAPSKLGGRLNEFALEAILALICVFFAFRAPGFVTSTNLFNILRNVSQQGIIAFGMTLVIIMGDIDLSVGNAIAWSGCLTAVITRELLLLNWPAGPVIALAMLAAILAGCLGGVLTGWLRTRFSVPAFITTLALMFAYKGGAYLITNSFPVIPFPEWYSFIGSGYIFGVIPFSSLVFAAVFGIMYFISKYTTFGRAVYAIGGNTEASRLSGINVPRTKMAVFAITGALAAISGIIVSSMCMAGTPQAGNGWELDVIAAVIIGGVSFAGGVGRIWGTFIGVIFLGIITNGMTLLNVDPYLQYIVKAGLILASVLIYQRQASRK
ncbi:MAG: ABC transporter permease [Patescibacteria group bacterium]